MLCGSFTKKGSISGSNRPISRYSIILLKTRLTSGMLICYYVQHKMTDKNLDKKTGTVTEALPNTLFRVQFEDAEETLCYLAGKMRMYRIKVLVGDKVEVVIDQYGGKGRITRRF